MPNHRCKPDRQLLFSLRSYQQQALELFRTKSAHGGKTFHLVAPPGSGKTVIGIALIIEAQKKAAVFSPSAAIQAQWVNRFYEATDILNTGNTTETSFSCDAESDATYLSLTYQSVTAKKRGTNELHENAIHLLNHIAANYGMLLLDECHHLTDFWGKTLSQLTADNPDLMVIGLTATPPVDATGKEQKIYIDLVGQIDLSIPLPAIVKEGNLAPYQDLIMLTRPDDDEQHALIRNEDEFNTMLSLLNRNNNPHIPLKLWIHACLDESKYGGTIFPFDKWLKDMPDTAIAYTRYLHASGIEIPINVIWLDEMEAACTPDDYAIILADYIRFTIGKGDLADTIINAMDNIGYTHQNGGFVPSASGTARCLTLSRSKLKAMDTILTRENDFMDDQLRVLILVDYEFGKKGSNGINAIDVMDYLTSHETTDVLDPVLLTGSSVLVDDDLLPLFRKEADRFANENGLRFSFSSSAECGYMRLDGSGPDWNTRTYVLMITDMLENGMTRCLVSTRSLLGEGWDSISLNTLIDLTVVAGFVSVNQIRGRTIRKDRNNPSKCANNWDIITVQPDVHIGLYDYLRLVRKHNQFYGVSDDGIIEKGPGHIHPLLSKGNIGNLTAHFNDINDNMLQRCMDRHKVYDQWQVGKSYRNADITCLECKPVLNRSSPRNINRDNKKIAWFNVTLDRRERQGKHRSTAVSAIALALGATMQMVYQFDFGIVTGAGLAGCWLLVEFLLLKRFFTTLKRQPHDDTSIRDTITWFSHIVFTTGQQCTIIDPSLTREDIIIHERTDNSFRIVLNNVDQETSFLFSDAVWELMGPVRNHKYVVEYREYRISLMDLTRRHLKQTATIPMEVTGCYPVPSLFGKNKKSAAVFHKIWIEFMGDCSMYYTRRGEGRKFVKAWIGKRAIELKREMKTVWE